MGVETPIPTASAMKKTGNGEKHAQINGNGRRVSFHADENGSQSFSNGAQSNGSLFPSSGSDISLDSKSSSASFPTLNQNLMRVQKTKDPFQYYDVLAILGNGSMGCVCKVKKRSTAVGGSARKVFLQRQRASNLKKILPCFSFCLPGNSAEETKAGILENYGVVYALKSIILDHVKNDTFVRELQNEIAILKNLDHPNICKAIETFEFKNQLYLVLELCSGGDLYSRDPYDELQARHIIHSVLDACAFLHKRNITHRDLKYENIMFASPTSPNIKIIDFGLSKKYFENQTLSQTVGTVYTMAPEVIQGKYCEKCDVWSIGVLAFMLMSSSLPFFGRSRREVIARIMDGRFYFKSRRWQSVTPEAKDFVSSLLVQDARHRPSCSDALTHQWFNDCKYFGDSANLAATQVVSSAVMDRVQASIQTFAGYTRLKKLALIVIAHKSSADEVGFLQQLFRIRFDVEKDGVITLEEFKNALSVYSYSDQELEKMFSEIDIDGGDDLAYKEFLAATIEAHGTIEESRIAEAFDLLDHDDTGYITVSNLTAFLGRDVPIEIIDEIIDEADISKDHKIDYDEFLGLWDGSFDEVMSKNLKDVRSKRIVRDSVFYQSLLEEGQDGAFLEEEREVSLKSAPPGAGKFFFDQEKEKSTRGIWF